MALLSNNFSNTLVDFSKFALLRSDENSPWKQVEPRGISLANQRQETKARNFGPRKVNEN